MMFMVTFSIFTPPTHGLLRRRRMLHAARRCIAAFCAGLAVLFGLGTVLAQVQTAPVVIADRPIARGEIISSADIRVELLPVSTVGSSYATDAGEITGLIAQIDIAVNDPISTHMARDAPLPPTGTTVIEVRLASNPDDLLPGDSVQLVSAVGCAGEDCVLAEEALVMAIGEAEASSLGSNERQVSFAMKPHAAAAVMELQQAGAIVAVMR